MEAAVNVLRRSAPFLVLVQFCGAVYLNCTSTHSGGLMTYSIDNPQLLETKNNCDYFWDNSSMVLANHKSKLGEVKNNSLDTLQTSRCFVELNWKASCTSKTGHAVDFTANCTTSCGNFSFIFKDGDGHSTLWFLAVLILPVAALVFLLFKFRMKICSGSTRGCGQCGGLYTSVKTQNTDTKPEEVVVENK